MNPGILAAIPGVISGIASIWGGAQANAANAAMAREQMAFQERMRSTQYQTAVEDMRKAGLNPALAYQQGGAGTPSGATAQHQNVMQQLPSTAADVVQAIQTIRRNAAEIENIQAKTDSERVQRQILHTSWLQNLLRYRVDQETLPALLARITAESRMSESNASEAAHTAELARLRIPEARALAQFYNSLGKYRPWVTGAKDVIGLLPRGLPARGSFLRKWD